MEHKKFYFADELIKDCYNECMEFMIGDKVRINHTNYIIIDTINNLDFNRVEYYLALI